jgi:hypothetical protein
VVIVIFGFDSGGIGGSGGDVGGMARVLVMIIVSGMIVMMLEVMVVWCQ